MFHAGRIQRWFLDGPSWLQEPFPQISVCTVKAASPDPKPISAIIESCEDFNEMRRKVAWIRRSIHNMRAKKEDRVVLPYITVMELQAATLNIVKIVQEESFPEELKYLRKKEPVKSNVKFLVPFLDKDGVMRVGGRLEHSALTFSQKNPALLPKDHHFVRARARYEHEKKKHPGPQLLLSLLRQEFWIVRGSDLAKQIVKRCVQCFKHTAQPITQVMGQLPASRVNPSPTFSQVGVDYAGPFQIAKRSGRKPPIYEKVYVAVFLFMVTKAIHLEWVTDLSTPKFLDALTRLIARRGLPADVYSDEGTNFVGAKSELAELQALLQSESHHKATHDFLTEMGINFHTNPPAAPHHGGLWEAGVKSMKHHLRRIMGQGHTLNLEEFATLLCQIEAILNSRPLTPLSNDPNDLSPLTPVHFLTGRPLTALPHPDLLSVPSNRLSRWQEVEKRRQDFWKAWSRDYLSQQHSRPKWYDVLPDLTPGVLVLILDHNATLGPQRWKLGRVTDVFPGDDEHTRACDVRTNITPKNPAGTILRRPIAKLAPLPIY